MTDVVLTANQYGKAENRVVRITRDTARHEIEDLNVTSQLRGDFAKAHTDGDNSHVVATDTQKNTIFAFAKDGVGSPEAFLLRLGDHFTGEFDWVTGGRWAAEQYRWTRINDHDHSFYRSGPETRTAVLVRDGDVDTMITGFYGLTVLKSTESGFVGYPKDKYTTLAETTDRILATDIATRWRYNTTDVDFNASYDAIRVPLWVGMMPERDAALDRVAEGLFRALDAKGKLPERLDARTLEGKGDAPPGFYAALIPLATPPAREVLTARLQTARKDGLYGSPPAYYDQNLILFAQGFTESRYRFGADGSLSPAWETRCLGRAR